MKTVETVAVREVVRGEKYAVPSSDGTREYQVQYSGSGDADPEYVALWSCNCKAGQYRRMCRHIRAVLAHIEAEEEEFEPAA